MTSADDVAKALGTAHDLIEELFYSAAYVPEARVKETLREVNRAMLLLKESGLNP